MRLSNPIGTTVHKLLEVLHRPRQGAQESYTEEHALVTSSFERPLLGGPRRSVLRRVKSQKMLRPDEPVLLSLTV